MARARNIKPGFFKNEMLAELDAFDRLLFIGLWCLADREGRIEDRPKRIKMELFPCDDYQVEQGLQALEQAGFIERYTAAEMAVIEVVNFAKHQSPHGTEKDSELPARDGEFTVHERSKNGCVTGTKRKGNGETTLNNVNPPCDNALNPDSLIPDSPNPEVQEPAAAGASVAAQEAGEAPIPDQPKAAGKFDPMTAKPGNVSTESWAAWCAHRKQLRKTLTEETCKRQAKALAAHHDPDAVIDLSIQQGWTGLFPEKITANVLRLPAQSRFTNLPKVNADEIRARTAENERLGVRRANF